MRAAFIIFVGVIGMSIAWVFPLVAVARGRALGRTVLTAWGLLVAYLLVVSLVLPGIVSLFSMSAGREMESHWVPEPTGVAAMIFLGWLWPLVFGSIGLLVRRRRN
jgi:hypothetical protein